MQKTLGGDRLGSGKKIKVDLHGYERSTHDLGYLWRSTMSAGTLVPFLVEVALPGDTFDIKLNCEMKTHPTVGPLFGSYKVQLDIFIAPIRLYQAQLHNNKLKIGLNMSTVKLPQMSLRIDPAATIIEEDPDNAQINPSCILSYLGIRGIGVIDPLEPDLVERQFNAIPLLMYWDCYKNYYANKQEEYGFVIHQESTGTIIDTIDDIEIGGTTLPQLPGTGFILLTSTTTTIINFTGATPQLNQIIFNTNKGQFTAEVVLTNVVTAAGTITGEWNIYRTGAIEIYSWNMLSNSDLPITSPKAYQFALSEIDQMREDILAAVALTTAIDISESANNPYSLLLEWGDGQSTYLNTQEGLALKTYQSDMFNNWLNTEWLDGTDGINEVTAIDTTGGSFNIDTFILSKKVYMMLTRIAVSGGSYDDWQDAVWAHERFLKPETPMYCGGLIKELVFQEVISNSESSNDQNSQPLGTLAGRGIMANKHKGGDIYIKVDEPSYIMGIVSLTPRIDYSQGNKWDVHLKTMDDFHKPALDEIGFQELIQEQMAWWTTEKTLAGTTFIQQSAGKQPAWLNYMTNVNQTRGNFAIKDNEMFMTLNRRYEKGQLASITDLTTYIDPVKFNHIFAETAIDAQNFWTQIAIDITTRRKMSAKVMPNL